MDERSQKNKKEQTNSGVSCSVTQRDSFVLVIDVDYVSDDVAIRIKK